MITSFDLPDIHLADSLVDIMSLSAEKLHQCAWLSALEASIGPDPSSSTGRAGAEASGAETTRMPELSQLTDASNVSAAAYTEAIQQFANDTASALLAEDPVGRTLRTTDVTVGATSAARSLLFAHALRGLQGREDVNREVLYSASGVRSAITRPPIANEPGTINTVAMVADVGGDALARLTQSAEMEKEQTTPCTSPASFSGDEADLAVTDMDKVPYMTLYVRDATLTTDWLADRIAANIDEARSPHQTAASAQLLEALAALVPRASTSGRAGDALMLLYTQILTASTDNEPSFVKAVVLPLLYLLPLLPWRSDQLPTLSQLVLIDGARIEKEVARASLPHPRNSKRTSASSPATAHTEATTTTLHVHVEVRGVLDTPTAAGGSAPSAATTTAAGGAMATLGVSGTAASATAGNGSHTDSAALDIDSDRFFEIPDTRPTSSTPFSTAEDADEPHSEAAVDATTNDDEEGEVEEANVYEDTSDFSEEDEESFVHSVSGGNYSLGTPVPDLSTGGEAATAVARAPEIPRDRRRHNTPPVTCVSSLVATGPVERVTVHVVHVAEGLLAGHTSACATTEPAPLALLICPLPSPVLSSSEPVGSRAPSQASIAVPLVVGEVASWAGPCRMLASSPLALAQTAVSSGQDDAASSAELLVKADLAITLRLPREEDPLLLELQTASTMAQSALAARLLGEVKRHATSQSAPVEPLSDPNATTATTAASTEINELLRPSLKIYASETDAAVATKAAAEAEAALAGTSDDRLRQHVRCLAADLPGVRAALRIAAYVMWPSVFLQHQDEPTQQPASATKTAAAAVGVLDWNNREWKEVLRRVHNASSSLGRCNMAEALSCFVLDDVMPNRNLASSPKQLIGQIQQLFTASVCPDGLEQALISRHTTATTAQHLTKVMPFLLERQPATAAAILIQLLALLGCGTSSSSSPGFRGASAGGNSSSIPAVSLGCGMQLEATLAAVLHTLVLAVVDALCGTLDRLLPFCGHGAKTDRHTQSVLASPQETPFVLLALALLVLRRDAYEAVVGDANRCLLLLELLPGPANLHGLGTSATPATANTPATASSSRAVEQEERRAFAFSAALCEMAVKTDLAHTGAEMFDGVEPEAVAAPDLGMPRVGPLEYLSSPAAITTDVGSLPKLTKIRSVDPLLSPGTSCLHEQLFNVAIRLDRLYMPTTPSSSATEGSGDDDLWLGLTPLPPTRSVVELLNDNKAVLVSPRGEAQVNGHTVPFFPFGEGDVIGFRVARLVEAVEAAVAQPCVMLVSLNGVDVLTLPAPKDRLYLVVASPSDITENTTRRGIVSVRLSPTTVGVLPSLTQFRYTVYDTPLTAHTSMAPRRQPDSGATPLALDGIATTVLQPTIIKTLGFASHVLHSLLLHAHSTVVLGRSATTGNNNSGSHSMISSSPWRSENGLTRAGGAPQPSSSAETRAMQLLTLAAAPLSRRLRQLVQSLEGFSALDAPEEAPWYHRRHDRCAMAKWVGTRCRAQLCGTLLDGGLAMAALILRTNPSLVDIATALVDVVAATGAPERAKSVALASLLLAIQSSGTGTAGFGLLAMNPGKLWAACVPLATSLHALGFRPRFSASSVDSRIAVEAGGRRVEYKFTNGPSTQPTTNYAEEGIPLDGSRGEVVCFSVRLQRSYRLDSLCRHYHIGVSCCRQQSTATLLHSHPGDRSRQHLTYTLSDYYNDAAEATRAELRRHHLHWMTSDIVYGSGDVITVVVHTRRRTIGFARNGMYLGTLYRNLPSSVCVLFPFVEMINRDSKGKWMQPVRETSIYARQTLRAMLSLWWNDLTPKLSRLLDDAAKGDSTGLALLGADGNELAMVYRTPPPSDGTSLLQHVRLVRIDGAFAIVELEGASAPAGTLRVWRAALEPLFTTELPSAPPVVPFVANLLKVTRAMAPRESHSSHASCAFVLHPGAFLRALRLLSTVTVPRDSETADGEVAEVEMETSLRHDMQQFVHYLIWLLQAKSSHTSVEMALIEAFNEASWLPRDDSVLPVTFTTAPTAPDDTEKTVSANNSSSSNNSDQPVEITPLLCPDCGESWSACTGQHTPPESVADLCDRVLRRIGVPSPYTGWVATWTASEPPAAQSITTHTEAALGGAAEEAEEIEETDDPAVTSAAAQSATTPDRASASENTVPPIPEDDDNTEGNYAVRTPTTISVHQDESDAAILHISGQCQYGLLTATVTARSSTVVKGRVTFKQSGWADDADSGIPDGEWSCEACTFVNEPGTTRCAICMTARPGAVWTCATCAYAFNPNSSSVCATCGQLRFAGVTRLLGRPQDAKVSFCEDCHAAEEYQTIRSLRLHRFCTACGKVTSWLPKRKYTGTMELRLGELGDVADLVMHVEKMTLTLTGLHAVDYSTAQLVAAVIAHDPSTPLTRYVPPIAPLREDSASSPVPLSNGSPVRLPPTIASFVASVGNQNQSGMSGSGALRQESHMRTAIVYYASLITLKWAPLMEGNLFVSPCVLRRVRVFDESWLALLDDLTTEDAIVCLSSCFKVLFFRADTTESSSAPPSQLSAIPPSAVPEVHVVTTTAAVARALIRHRPSLQCLRSALLYALARIAAAVPSDTARREVCCTAMTELFEDAPLSPVNVRCLTPIHSLRPMVPGQRRCIVFSLLHGAQLESPLASTTATCCLVKAMDAMTKSLPVPAVLDMDVMAALPYTVALAETTVNEGGDLQVGQVRGSFGIAPTTGGKYYYEVVLPSNFDEGSSNVIVMGWGTQQHEHLSSTQHVGSDLHSWGFNCRDRLRLMVSEQLLPTSQAPTAGDVIGSMMDLSTMMVCWTINGEEIMWVSVPSQGDSEKIYPYVSASVEPCGVEVRLAQTQFCPEGYRDYSAASTAALWGRVSEAALPRSYDFYRQLCVFLSEAGINELNMTSSEGVSATLASSRKAQQELRAFPAVQAVVQEVQLRGQATSDAHWLHLAPYITHLRGVGHLAVLVTQVFSSVKASPFLSEMYDKARDLFLSGVRWTIFESQLGIRPSFSSRPPMTVEIDLEKARSALQRVDAETFVNPAPVRFADSVTGQLFHQTRRSRIYKNAAMFAVKLAGDVAVDGGGVTRSVLSMIAEELSFQMVDHQRVDPPVPLFKLCGHSTIFTVVPNMELILGDPTASSSEATASPTDPFTAASAHVATPPNVRDGVLGGVEGAAGTGTTPPSSLTPAQQRQEQAAQTLAALTWLGRLIGNLTLCGTLKMPLFFPRLVWKFLTFKDVTIEDYYCDIDDTVRGALEDEDFLMDDALFETIPGILSRRGSGDSSAAVAASAVEGGLGMVTGGGSVVDLDNSGSAIYGGGGGAFGQQSRELARGVSMAALAGLHGAGSASRSAGAAGGLRQARFLTPAASMQNMSRIVTAMSALDDLEEAQAQLHAEEVKRRLETAQQALLHQFDPALHAIRTGLTSVIPASALKSIRWDDLQSRVCGTAHCSADQILAFMDCTRLSDELRAMLATVLDDFSATQRSLFLLFCAGQSRLPLPEQISVSCGDDATQLPTAHTCSPISLRLQPYTTAEQLRLKLEVCLQNATQFGFV